MRLEIYLDFLLEPIFVVLLLCQIQILVSTHFLVVFQGLQMQLLLIEDGVYLALEQAIDCAALRSDVEARGLLERLPASVRLIDHGEFVAMTVEADHICCWF